METDKQIQKILLEAGSSSSSATDPDISPEPLSHQGLLQGIPKNLDIPISKTLDKSHQALINKVFIDYYHGSIFRKSDDNIPKNPWYFGGIYYIQANCCGKIFKKSYFSQGQNQRQDIICCPACGSQEIRDQLYCMNLCYYPTTKKIDYGYRALTLKDYLTIILLQSAIKKRHYFLLEHLCLMIANKQFINYHDIYGKTLLHYAIESNDIVSTLILIKHGADINSISAYMYLPLDYLNQAHRLPDPTLNFTDLKEILIQYGARSSTESQTAREDSILKNVTISQEGSRLHFACKQVNEGLVHNLCLDKTLNVNITNSSNYTPLAMLAYFGSSQRSSISIIHFAETISKHRSSISYAFEILLRLQEVGVIFSENFERYKHFVRLSSTKKESIKNEPSFSIFEEIFDFFSSRDRRALIHGLNALNLNSTEENHHLLLSHRINWQNYSAEKLLYDADFDKSLKKWCNSASEKSKQNKTIHFKLLFPCELKHSLSLIVCLITWENGKAVVSLKNHHLTGNMDESSKIPIMYISQWIEKNFSCSPIILENPNQILQSSRIETVLKAISLISQEVMLPINEADCFDHYFSYRVKSPLFLNQDKKDIKGIYEEVLEKEFNLKPEGDLVQESSLISKQEYIIRKLVERNADVGTHSSLMNVFSLAAHRYNVQFIRKLIDMGVSPFVQGSANLLLQNLPYDFIALDRILPHYNLRKYGNVNADLHSCASLAQGNVEVFLSDRSRVKVNLISEIIKQGKKLKERGLPEILYLKERNQNLETPIFTAIRCKNIEAIKIFIKNGASLLVKNKQNILPVELFSLDYKNESRNSVHIVSKKMDITLNEIWHLIRGETERQLQLDLRNSLSGHETALSKEDIKRLEAAKLIERVTPKSKQLSAFSTFTFTPKVSVNGKDAKQISKRKGVPIDEIDEDDEKPVIVKMRRKLKQVEENEIAPIAITEETAHQLIRTLDKLLENLNNFNIDQYTTSQNDQLLLLTMISSAFQLIKYINFEEVKQRKQSYSDKLTKILLSVVDKVVEKEDFLLQMLLTVGTLDSKWEADILHALASFFRKNIETGMSNEKILMSFFCEMLRTHQENDYDNTILRLHVEKFDLKLLDENTGLKFNCLEILQNNHALFTKIAHKMGFCCFSDMT